MTLGLCGLWLGGCASPGAPRPPSLYLPAVPAAVDVVRQGPAVRVRFSLPTRTTDGLPLRAEPLQARFCVERAPGTRCAEVPVPSGAGMLPADARGKSPEVQWSVPLPAALTAGAPRSAAMRVKILNADGKGAGYSAPGWFAAGQAPPPVLDLTAAGTRNGVVLRWAPVVDGGEVLVQREPIGAAPKAGSRDGKTEEAAVLQADPGNRSAAATLDPAAAPGVRFRYTAERRRRVQVGGRSLELRSAESAPVEFTWRDIYPPAAPEGLRAIGFVAPGAEAARTPTYAVDLIWEPVDDARVTGYVVERTPLRAAASGRPEVLTPHPVTAPAFHDATAMQGQAYRYAVTAVDGAGNRSAAAMAEVSGR